MPARCSPCRLQHLQPRRILIWDDLEIRSLSDFLGAVLESHDLIAREGRGGEIELAPRASCLAARSIDPSAGPHPALARLGLGTSDRIVSVDGAALESSPSQLAEHLRSQESALLGVQSPNGKVRGLKIRAAVLLAMLQPLSR
jgi:hypothetical protein